MSYSISAGSLYYKELNKRIREQDDREIIVDDCAGQRYIGDGLSGVSITVNGTPGNALGAYLDGAEITVHGNAQDAIGDTMNDGRIVVHGGAGDAAGYAMRGGEIYIRDNVGYRAGIHMKAYHDKHPAIIVGGGAGSFLGEYQAGGYIIVLGLGVTGVPVGYFCGTGMHGGRIFLRSEQPPSDLPEQVSVRRATDRDIEKISGYIDRWCALFGRDRSEILPHSFYVLSPNTKNPYKQLYTVN